MIGTLDTYAYAVMVTFGSCIYVLVKHPDLMEPFFVFLKSHKLLVLGVGMLVILAIVAGMFDVRGADHEHDHDQHGEHHDERAALSTADAMPVLYDRFHCSVHSTWISRPSASSLTAQCLES